MHTVSLVKSSFKLCRKILENTVHYRFSLVPRLSHAHKEKEGLLVSTACACSVAPGNLRWVWNMYEAQYVVGEFTACYPENLQNYLAQAQAVDTRPSSQHTRGPGNKANYPYRPALSYMYMYIVSFQVLPHPVMSYRFPPSLPRHHTLTGSSTALNPPCRCTHTSSPTSLMYCAGKVLNRASLSLWMVFLGAGGVWSLSSRTSSNKM